MRDRIAHSYETLDIKVVWATAPGDLQPLIARLEPILTALPDPDASTPD